MGYHPGAEDDGIYLTAIKSKITPTLFPHDAAFFQLQMRTSIFDTLVADFVKLTGIPVMWSVFIWQCISIFMVVWAAWSILRLLFKENTAIWAGVAFLTAMFTLPVSGTALYLMDQHLHPRSLSTALILIAVSRILAKKHWQAIPLVILAFVLHPLMGAMGISFCFMLSIVFYEPTWIWFANLRHHKIPMSVSPALVFIPFGWILNTPSSAWVNAMQTRHCYQLYQWEWYEWLGAIGPLVLFALLAYVAYKRGESKLAGFSFAVFLYGTFHQILAMAILSPKMPLGFATLEPMRYLHLVYIFLVLIGGALLGRFVLRSNLVFWAIFLIVTNASMFYVQRQIFPSSPHIEMPDVQSGNQWLQAFDWVRINTPVNAYFAMDAHYMEADGDDYHSFRALAERSVMADAVKDTAAVTKNPELGSEWDRQTRALAGWKNFQLADFERLKRDFQVDWVVVDSTQSAGLDCQWHSKALSVCRIP